MSKTRKKAAKYLAWFAVGQVVQVVLATLAKASYMNRPILFCIAAGFLVSVAICAGVSLATADEKKSLSYQDYADMENYQ